MTFVIATPAINWSQQSPCYTVMLSSSNLYNIIIIRWVKIFYMSRGWHIKFVANTKLAMIVHTKSINFMVFVYVKTMMFAAKNINCIFCTYFVHFKLIFLFIPWSNLSSYFTTFRITPTINITFVRQSKSVLWTTSDLFYFLFCFITEKILTNTSWGLYFCSWLTTYNSLKKFNK